MEKSYKNLREFKNHEKIIELNDPESGLKGFIAIHNTSLGPALGGTRMYPYKNKTEALKDVLRLSYSMTYKCAIAGLKFGGGKGVIIADPKKVDKKKILKAYAEAVSKLAGKFYTGEDVGITEGDVQYMLKFSPYFIGKSHLAGDPSPYAALSAFLCLKEALKNKFGSDNIKDRTFAIKGVGKTGSELTKLIYQEGGRIIICDKNKSQIKAMVSKYPKIKVVSHLEIQKQIADVYCPCAMGDDIDFQAAKTLKVQIICGTANNQLKENNAAKILFQRGIIHVPDYVANAGGLIDVSAELWRGGYSKRKVLKAIKNLRQVIKNILKRSLKAKEDPNTVAHQMAKENFTKTSTKFKFNLKKIRAIFSYA